MTDRDRGSGIRDRAFFGGAARDVHRHAQHRAQAQTPRLSNGRIESHATTNIARDLPALAATLTEPMWIGYAQPLIDGDHQMCDYWNNGNRYTQSTDPIRLEPADFFFVMFRIEEKQITRIRTYSANCPLDAGGKAVHWFTNVSVNDSVSYMKTFMGPTATRKMNDSAVTVLALTEGDQPLNELLTSRATARPRASRATRCSGSRSAPAQKAVGTITAAIENDPDTEVKKKAVFALSQLPKDEGVPLLIQQARTNKNPAVRKQAMFWLGQSKDPRALRVFRGNPEVTGPPTLGQPRIIQRSEVTEMRKAVLLALTLLSVPSRLGRRSLPFDLDARTGGARVLAQGRPANGEWTADTRNTWRDDDGEPRVQFNLRTGAGDSRWGFGVRLRDLAGLPSAAVANMANDVQFTWTREAGTFRFNGSFDQGRGSGTYTFTQDQTFVNNMAGAGYKNLTVDDIVRLAVIDVTVAHVRGLAQAGYPNLSLDDVVRTRIHRVTPEFVRDLAGGRLQGHRRRRSDPHGHSRRDAGEHQGAAGAGIRGQSVEDLIQLPHPQGHAGVHQGDGSARLQERACAKTS